MTTAEGCVWLQREISIPAKKRGCHLISDEFTRLVPEIEQIKIGLANVHSKIFFIQQADKRVPHTCSIDKSWKWYMTPKTLEKLSIQCCSNGLFRGFHCV